MEFLIQYFKTNSMNTYAEKLKDPRWQKKRLQIMNRDGFKCQKCFNDQRTLHVHHKKYEQGLEPWEYDTELLITLCESCHEGEGLMKGASNELVEVLYKLGFLNEHFVSLAYKLNHIMPLLSEEHPIAWGVVQFFQLLSRIDNDDEFRKVILELIKEDNVSF